MSADAVPASAAVQRITLIVVCIATAILMLDIAVVNTALPSIGGEFHAQITGLKWIVDAYTLTLAAAVLGAALLFACSLALLAHAFPAGKQRLGALSLYGATIGASFAVGPLVTAANGWRPWRSERSCSP